MAVVYLAQDRKLGRSVALKVLRPELAASLGAERFLCEIAIAAQLSHPNILPLHESGEAAGLLYYTMPYVTGESLRDRLRRERQLPIEEAVAIASQVAEALGHAHGQGIVHRDIKPENVRRGRLETRRLRIGLPVLAAVVLLVQVVSAFGPPPPSITVVAVSGIATPLVIAATVYWLERTTDPGRVLG